MKFVKMSNRQKKVQCIFWSTKTKSDIQAQQNVRRKCGKEASTRSAILSENKRFIKTGSVQQKKESWPASNFRRKHFLIGGLNVMVSSFDRLIPGTLPP